MNEKDKAEELIRIMGKTLAERYVTAKIAHWESDEFKPIRTISKEYWVHVLYCFL
jgi:hypothetical protein